MKTCSRCNTARPLAEFYRDNQRPDGIAIWCKPCKRAANMRTYYKNPDAYRDRWLRRAYGISLEHYQELARSQDDCCGICRMAAARTLAVDHDHVTGAIRGLLCADCNRAIGLFRDDPGLLRAAANYIEACRV